MYIYIYIQIHLSIIIIIIVLLLLQPIPVRFHASSGRQLVNQDCQTLLRWTNSKSKPINSPRVLVPIAYQPIKTIKPSWIHFKLMGNTGCSGLATLLVSQKNETSQEGNGRHLVGDTGQQTCCWQTQETIRTTCNIQRFAWNNSKLYSSQSILNNRNPNNTCSPHPKKTCQWKRSRQNMFHFPSCNWNKFFCSPADRVHFCFEIWPSPFLP